MFEHGRLQKELSFAISLRLEGSGNINCHAADGIFGSFAIRVFLRPNSLLIIFYPSAK
jgi:hypothetical protein